MAVITKWSNVAIAVQSAIATAVTITGITKANPGVVTTSAAHGYSTGDYVLVTAQGMYQVNARVFRISAASGSTFTLEGVDTTNYATFTSGTVQKLTLGTTLSTLTNVNASGGDFDFKDTTTIHDNVRSQVPGLASPSKYDFESIWDPSDAGLVALKSASDAQAQRAVMVTFANGSRFVFYGYPACTLAPTGTAQDIVKTNVSITAQGLPNNYAT